MTQGLAAWGRARAAELDGVLVERGRRLADLSGHELLNLVYARLVAGMTERQRYELHATLLGRRSRDGGWVVDDPLAPESLRGRVAPAWWGSPDEPAVTMQTLNL